MTDAEADCVAAELVPADEVVDPALDVAAPDPQAYLLDPAAASVVGTALTNCVDVGPALAAHAVDRGITEPPTGCIDVAAVDGETTVALVAGDLAATSAADPSVVTALRPCLEGDDLALLLGVPGPSELAETLLLDPFAPFAHVGVQDPCRVRAVLDSFGPERLGELGIGLDSDRGNLWVSATREEREAAVEALSTCGDLRTQFEAALALDSPPDVVDCTSAALSDDDLVAVTFSAMNTRFLSADGLYLATRGCIEASLETLFGPRPTDDSDASLGPERWELRRILKYDLYSSWYGTYGRQCFYRGIETSITDLPDSAVNALFTADPDPESMFLFARAIQSVFDRCLVPTERLGPSFDEAGIDHQDVWCVLATIDRDRIAPLRGLGTRSLLGDDVTDDASAVLDEVERTIADCADAPTAAHWRDLVVSGGGFGAPDA